MENPVLKEGNLKFVENVVLCSKVAFARNIFGMHTMLIKVKLMKIVLL